MTRLILTTSDSGAGSLKQASIADIVIPFGLRFVRGPLPSDAALTRLLAERRPKHDPAVPYPGVPVRHETCWLTANYAFAWMQRPPLNTPLVTSGSRQDIHPGNPSCSADRCWPG